MTDFTATRALFDLPDGVIYLDGNSLGPLPKSVPPRVARTIAAEWGGMLIGGWNDAGWMDLPRRVGDRIGRLVGAAPGTVMTGDTLSVKVFQALAAALDLRPDRKVILSDNGNFPGDLYVASGLVRSLAAGHELRLVAPEAVDSAIAEDVAVLLLTEVDYRTGRRHDMARLTARAHAAGALTIWDLAHSAGALPVDLAGTGADMAVGCTYKYLNAGPGAPAFIYVRPDLTDTIRPTLAGWLGHDAPFAFDRDYRAGRGIARMRVGTPPVLQLAALDAALDIWEGVNMNDIRQASVTLSTLFIREVEARAPGLALVSPRDPALRGSQVSFRHPDGHAFIRALAAHGVVGDFRAPDILRFGITPLYIGAEDITRAAALIGDVLASRSWDRAAYRRRAPVT